MPALPPNRAHVLPSLALAAALLPLCAGGASRGGSFEAWIEGPIRYIATVDETRAFRALESDAQRAAFVERFWGRRDSSPQTLVNESRQTFWERVKAANVQFRETSSPGWKTDRGKIFIVYGPPNDVQEDRDATVDVQRASGRGIVRWFYPGRPEGRPDAPAFVIVPFVRDATGEYRLSRDPKLAGLGYNRFDPQLGRPQGRWQEWYERNARPYGSELSVMLDQGRIQEVPGQEQILLESITTTEAIGQMPLEVDIQRLRHPGKSGTLVVLTAALPQGGAPDVPALLARFVPQNASRAPVILAEGSFRTQGSGRWRVVQGRVVLAPGMWDLLAIAADPEDGVARVYRGRVEIPEPTERLRLSDVGFAREFEPLPYASLTSYDEPFVVGTFRAVPRVDRELHAGEPVTLFYEIYGGEGPYRVEYRLEGREKDGRWVALGKPQVLENAEGAQGFTLPTAPEWPQTDYRVVLRVEDRARASVESIVHFTLLPASA